MTDNELIAEFMDRKVNAVTSDGSVFLEPDFAGQIPPIALYSVKWDALMPVVEKIEGMNYYHHLTKNRLDRNFYSSFVDWDCNTIAYTLPSKTRIESVYNSVVNFIKWYKETTDQTVQ